MSSTSEALVELAEQKEQLRVIANRYLDNADKLPVSCTLQDIIDVLDEYDEYSYMNAFLNSIEVFPDKDYSINDTEGHIKSIRPYAFYNNTALKSVKLSNVDAVGVQAFYGCNKLETFDIKCNSISQGAFASTTGNFVIRGITSIPYWIFQNGDYGSGNASINKVCFVDALSLGHGISLGYLSALNMSFPSITIFNPSNYALENCNRVKTIIIGGICQLNNYTLGLTATTPLEAFIFTNQNGLSTLGGSTLVDNMLLPPNAQYYVPSTLLSQYQSATNWTAINDVRPIKDIESNINDLRELGADFSFTPYANKKWENNQLVDDATIGEEVAE